MVHESWYLQFILNLHISSYLLVSLAHPLLSPSSLFSVASDGRRVWSRRDGKLNANRAGVLWEDQDSISAGKSVLSITATILYTYRLQIIKQPQLVLFIKQHPSIPLEFFIFPTFWGTVKSTSSPANPSCKVRRTCWHSSEGITFAAEFSAVHLWLAVPASVAEESVDTERGVKTWQWIVEVVKTNQNRSLLISFEEICL